MKKTFIVANWKSNKTESEAKDWLSEISIFFKDQALNLSNKEIIVCPSFVHLPAMKTFIEEQKLPIKLGAQDVSPFPEGAYTGQVAARQVVEFATYSIVGHSERRKYFHQTNKDVINEVKILLENKLIPILCISDMIQMDYYLAHGKIILDNAEDIIFVYEPPGAISGGGAYRPESPENANQNAAKISNKIGKPVITIYGGSVNPDNAIFLFSQKNIYGGLVGQASLDPKKFYAIIQNA